MTRTNPERKRGIILLSVGRSGTNWLKSIMAATGRMGIMEEWMGFETLERPWKTYTAQSYYDHIMHQASTENSRFALKIFPRHLRHAQACFDFDFIRKCAREHDVKFYLLTRQDRFSQAVSTLKAKQTQAWHSDREEARTQNRPLRYNFRRLCRHYFEIGQAYDLWRSYLMINGYDYEAYSYESLLPDPSPFLKSAAAHLQTPPPESTYSPLKIQRDALSEEWRQRFLEQIAREGIHPATYDLQQPKASIENALRVLGNRPIKPNAGGA